MRKQLILCLSLSNLCFLPGWLELFRFSAAAPDQMRSPAAWALFGATLCNVIALTAVFFVGKRLSWRLQNPLIDKTVSCVFLFVTAAAVDRLVWQGVCWGVQQGLRQAPLLVTWAVLITIPLTGCLLVSLYDNALLVRASKLLLRVLAPLPLVFSFSFLWAAVKAPSWPTEAKLAPRNTSPPEHRVVWIVFDEWDQHLMFDIRPSDVDAPEVDQLLCESLYCTRAESPAWDTPESIAALITGRKVSKLYDGTSGETPLRLEDGSSIDFNTSPNVFSETRRMGINAGLEGWYLPYCRILGPSLTSCWCPTLADVKSHNLSEISIHQLRDQLRLHWIPAWFGHALLERNPTVAASIADRQEWISAYLSLSNRARSVLKDPSLGLVFLHWTLPHPPGIWDRHTDNFTVHFSSNYLDNLELVDRTVAQVRRALKEAGLARRTSLIITSDHPFRPDEWSKNTTWTTEEARLTQMHRFPYVPFIVQAAGDKRPVRFDKPFKTIASGRLVLALLRGDVKDNQAAASWLARESTQRSMNGF